MYIFIVLTIVIHYCYCFYLYTLGLTIIVIVIIIITIFSTSIRIGISISSSISLVHTLYHMCIYVYTYLVVLLPCKGLYAASPTCYTRILPCLPQKNYLEMVHSMSTRNLSMNLGK